MINKITGFLLALTVFLWVLPLGAFIRPSQEETACGGKRAFHMCSMCFGKFNPHPPQKTGISAASGLNDTAKSASSAGEDFLPVASVRQLRRIKSKHYGLVQSFLPQSPQSLIFHPPKSTILF